MNRLTLEIGLHWGAIAGYLAATVVLVYAVMFGRPERGRWGAWVAAVGLLPHSAALILRWITSGHGPYMARYEVLSSNSWVAVVVLLLFLWRRPAWTAVSLVAMPAVLLMMGLALFANPAVRELPPTLRSLWLVFHVTCAKLAAGAWLLATASAVLLLFKRRGRTGRVIDRFPDADALDAYAVRLVGFGFVFWTISVAAGAVWANESWGRYWGWDPIETWSLITWLCYGTLLHARLFFKLRGASIAGMTIGCLVVAVVAVFILPFVMPSIHAAYFQ